MKKHGNRRLPVHRPLDDGVVQRSPDVSDVFARQQPTVDIGREQVQVVGRLERQEMTKNAENIHLFIERRRFAANNVSSDLDILQNGFDLIEQLRVVG